MTEREKILAAFEIAGTRDIPAVSCYETISIRDHWDKLLEVPWWYKDSGVPGGELSWMKNVIDKTGLDMLLQKPCMSYEERGCISYEIGSNGVYRIDTESGKRTRLNKPAAEGKDTDFVRDRTFDLERLPKT